MQMLSVDQLVGRTLGEYRIERLLGHGQSGAAFLARHLSLGRAVMITTFNFPEGSSTQERNRLTARFAQERAMLVGLTHPHILPIYDFGEQAGYLYLVTACSKGASLGQVLKQQGRFTPDQTLGVLKQLALGLDYAHSQGVVHSILSLFNMLISNDLTVQITGFGLRTMLEVRGNTQHTAPQAYLFSTSGTLLGSPESVSPEGVLGEPVDARSDIYALGVMLFELLSGAPPFHGATPLETAQQRIHQPVPSLHAVCPDVPEALDLVISTTLECDPAKRYQRAGDIAAAFERACTVLEVTPATNASNTRQVAQGPQLILPPTVNRFDDADMLPSPKTARGGAGEGPMKLPGAATQPDAPTERLPTEAAFPSPAEGHPDSMEGVDLVAWWSAPSARPLSSPPTPGTSVRRSPVRLAKSTPRSRHQPAPTQLSRRKLVTLLAAGTAGVITVVTVGGISFARVPQGTKPSPSEIADDGPRASSTPTTTRKGREGEKERDGEGKGERERDGEGKGAKPTPTQQPTQPPTPQPTQPPSPTTTPPGGHTGTVIGYTNQATNSAVSFTNPADGQGSLLMHLSNGTFVACERACTHQGVPVNYVAGSGQLVCPAHGAVFDPLHGCSHVSGPGSGPLATVSIRVNADGTITTG